MSESMTEAQWKETQRAWARIMTAAVTRYRKEFPDDLREDAELCDDLMTHFEKAGVISRKDGKWQIGRIKDLDELIRMIEQDPI